MGRLLGAAGALVVGMALLTGLAACGAELDETGPGGGDEPRGATGKAVVVLDVPAESAETGAASLSLAGGPSLTRLPAAEERSGWVYTLSFVNVEGKYTHDELAVTPGEPVVVPLEAGAWTIIAHARKGGEEVGLGSVTIMVAEEEATTDALKNVYLAPRRQTWPPRPWTSSPRYGTRNIR